MTVTVPPRLARREAAAPTDAFLLRDPARLPATLSALGPKPPAVFRVAGGFLLVPADAYPHRLPAAIPLRRLAGDLYTPADADLVPTLLPDELAALTRDRGLVVLPGQTLGFAADRPLAPADWLQLPPVARDAWGPLPDPEPLADRLTVIERPAGSVIVEQLLAEGEPEDRDPLGGESIPEDARPPAGGPVDKLAAGANFAAGKLLAGLGKLLGSKGLTSFGAGLIGKAVERVPRLTEKVFGAQEAALRQLLKQLQSGDAEAALRRAPIAVGDPSAPARAETGSRLFSRDIGYSLRSLLGGGGVASAWLGGGDVWHQLAAEYRRQAAAAAARGDHRRAAYIHGVLLRDLHSAAAALLKGGLFRDAAILYRDRLNSPVPAARAFDQAGDHDEAVRLYVRAGHDEDAGDLLLRLGLADRAAERFVAVANRHVVAGRHLAAGDLLRTKLGDRAAGGYYLSGWDGNGPEAVACGERLFDFLARQADWPGVRALLADADARLGPPRTADAGRFFNRARSADLPADLRDELDDQARLLFAAHVRAAPATARTLFNSWPGPVTRDALFAARGADRPEPGASPVVPLADGTTLAVAVARGTADLLVATDQAVVLWRPDTGRVLPVCRPGGRRVVGLSVSPDGERVFVLKTDGTDLVLDSYAAAGERFEYRCQRRFPNAAEAKGGWALHPARHAPGAGRAGDAAAPRPDPDARPGRRPAGGGAGSRPVPDRGRQPAVGVAAEQIGSVPPRRQADAGRCLDHPFATGRTARQPTGGAAGGLADGRRAAGVGRSRCRRGAALGRVEG